MRRSKRRSGASRRRRVPPHAGAPSGGAGALEAAFADVCADAERRGVTGRPALWAGERARLREELLSAVEAEAEDPAGWRPVPLRGGLRHEWREDSIAPLVYRLADGTALSCGVVSTGSMCRPTGGAPASSITRPAGSGRRRRRIAWSRARAPAARVPAGGRGAPGRREPAAEVDDAQYYHVIGPDAGNADSLHAGRLGVASRRLRPRAPDDRRWHPWRSLLPAAGRVRRPGAVRLRPRVRRRARAVGGGQARRSQRPRSRGPRGDRVTDQTGEDRAGLDQDARRRALEDLDTTFLVEAAAGSGKTTLLLGRIVNLVRSGRRASPRSRPSRSPRRPPPTSRFACAASWRAPVSTRPSASSRSPGSGRSTRRRRAPP